MSLSSDAMTATYTTSGSASRPLSTRAAFAIWATASAGGWLAIGGLLRVVGVF